MMIGVALDPELCAGSQKKPRNATYWRRAARLMLLSSLLLGLPLILAGCSNMNLTFLVPRGAIAAQQRNDFIQIVALVAIVIIPVLLAVPWMVWHYRYGKSRARYRPNWQFSWPLEFAIWGGPFAVVAVLAILLIHNTLPLDPYRSIASQAPALRVQVIGYDWKWLFIYPEFRVASLGEMVFPADRPVTFQITSATVMQSFFIPALGSQIYAMAGMQTQLNLVADKTGTFLGENTQYNGNGFYQQKFLARAVTDKAFDDWITNARTKGVPLTAVVAGMLSRRSTVDGLLTDLGLAADPSGLSRISFSTVPPDFFGDVIHAVSAGSPGLAQKEAPNPAGMEVRP